MDWKNKRVFVSGGSGVIGMALVNGLLEQGASLMVGDLKPQPHQWKNRLHYRQGDLNTLSPKEIIEFSPEIYFHLAATFERSLETKDFWEENFHHNILLSHHLLSLLKELPSLKKILFASSYLIYHPQDYLFPTPQSNAVPLKEEGKISPRNLCGMAKLLHEQELAFVKKFRPELQIISARIFRSYGKQSRDIISRWIQSLSNHPHELLQVYRPEGRFDFVFAEDIALALQQLAETDFSGVVNIGSGKARSIHEVLMILKQHFPSLSYQVEGSDIPYEASQADLALFRRILPNFIFRPLEEGIQALFQKNVASGNQPLYKDK